MDIHKKFKVISEISNSFMTSKDLKTVGEKIFDILQKYDPLYESGGKLAVYDKKSDIYEVVFYQRRSDSPVDFKIKCNLKEVKLFCGLAIERKEIVLINNSHSYKALKIDPILKDHPVKTMIFMPLYCDDGLLGLLSYARWGKNAIDKKLLNFLKVLGNYIRTVLENLLNRKYRLIHENEQKKNNIRNGTTYCDEFELLRWCIKLVFKRFRKRNFKVNNLISELGCKHKKLSIPCQNRFGKTLKEIIDIVKLSFVIDFIYLDKKLIWKKFGFPSPDGLARTIKNRTGKTREEIQNLLEGKTKIEKDIIKKELLKFDISILIGFLRKK